MRGIEDSLSNLYKGRAGARWDALGHVGTMYHVKQGLSGTPRDAYGH